MAEAIWDRAAWHTSRRSAEGSNCVAWAVLDGSGVGLRDSKDRDGPVLVFGRATWTAFVESVKRGEFSR